MLRRIRIRGFKSFAGDVTLDLGPGVNVIVGPNGSGKSNFGEAISWALGEQRASRLRAPGMHDILYQGTEARQAAGLAEVALQFDGVSDGPAEVEVSRRLTRAGDSSYMLNGASCRLLDLHESLAERGLGGESLAVIRQGQVEALATSRPVERRAMLDEAAGVGVTKRRRKRAEQKLARVAEKLDRARDLAAELTSRARALDRQARAAERAAAFDAEIREVRETEQAVRAFAAADGLIAATATSEERQQHDSAAGAALDAARAARATSNELRTSAVSQLERAETIASSLRAATDRVAGRAELATERRNELQTRRERLGHARADAAEQLARLEAEAAEAHETRDRSSAAVAAAQVAERAAEEAELELRAAELHAIEAVRRIDTDRAASEAAIADAQRRVAYANDAIGRAISQLDVLDTQDGAQDDRTERRADIAERRAERDLRRLADATADNDGAASELRQAESRQREAAADARLLAPDEDSSSVGDTLGDGLQVEAGSERALAAALGAYADAVLVSDIANARDALTNGASTAIVPAPERANGRSVAGARAMIDVVTDCSADVRRHLERLLADAWLVDSLEGVPTDHPGLFVTADGVAYRPVDGIVSAARGSWARRALHARAVADEAAARVEVSRLTQLMSECQFRRDGMRQRCVATERSRAAAAHALATARAQIAARSERRERLRSEHEEARRLHEDATRIVDEETASLADLAEALTRAQATVVTAREAAQSGANELTRARETFRSVSSDHAAIDARSSEAAASLSAARALIGAADMLPADLALVERSVLVIQAAADALVPVCVDAANELAERRSAFSTAEEGLAAAQRAAEVAEIDAAGHRERLHVAQVDLRLAQERVSEAGPAPAERPENVGTPEEVAERLADLERRRLAIGAVNELAGTERAELAERETHINEQIADLTRSCDHLTAHLGELDAAVGEGFDAVFQTVSDRFAEVVGLLFPGGTGRLRLVAAEDEDGDEGVEVEVVPAGKRPRALSLMSGGERSLIAMGFCLALAMARPAPFYLLDEVEAALDDANLRRFLAVVKQLASETQFLVITHQQPTVEIADTLFGVTMGGDGVTQVLSRKLAESVESATPYVSRQLRLVNAR